MKTLMAVIILAVIVGVSFSHAQTYTILDQRDELNASIADSRTKISQDNDNIDKQNDKISIWRGLIDQAQAVINGYQEDIAKNNHRIDLANFSLNAIANDVEAYEQYLANQANQQNNEIIP
jgi:septal ring factor EnvC (AmiA/AmiB activator)